MRQATRGKNEETIICGQTPDRFETLRSHPACQSAVLDELVDSTDVVCDLRRMSAAASGVFAVVPRHVLGGRGYVAPNNKITLAHIGMGTQGFNELGGLL